MDMCGIKIKDGETTNDETGTIVDACYQIFVVDDGSYNLMSGSSTSTGTGTGVKIINKSKDSDISQIDICDNTVLVKQLLKKQRFYDCCKNVFLSIKVKITTIMVVIVIKCIGILFLKDGGTIIILKDLGYFFE